MKSLRNTPPTRIGLPRSTAHHGCIEPDQGSVPFIDVHDIVVSLASLARSGPEIDEKVVL